MKEAVNNLADMSLQELWELFPLALVQPCDAWSYWYEEVRDRLAEVLSGFPVERISHVGSTAIDGICSKNIVDVLVEVSPDFELSDVSRALEDDGFIRMSESAGRISLNLGYTKSGYAEKVYHIHLRHAGDNDELYFRDYLNEHPDVARDYEALKFRLAARFASDRDAYTAAKTDFVKRWSEQGRQAYPGRY